MKRTIIVRDHSPEKRIISGIIINEITPLHEERDPSVINQRLEIPPNHVLELRIKRKYERVIDKVKKAEGD